MNERHLTTGQAARAVRVSPNTVKKWIICGLLKGYRLPGSRFCRVSPEALAEFCAKNNMPAPEFAR